jgi:excisionase family DNA binding protein
MEEYISVLEAAERRQVSLTAIYKAIREGRLNATRILGRLALRTSDIDACEFGSYAGVQRARKRRGPTARKVDGK